MQEIRCKKCRLLLGKASPDSTGLLSIKCRKCGERNDTRLSEGDPSGRLKNENQRPKAA